MTTQPDVKPLSEQELKDEMYPYPTHANILIRKIEQIKKQAKEKYEDIEKRLFEAEKRTEAKTQKIKELIDEHQKMLVNNIDMIREKDSAQEELRKLKKELAIIKKDRDSLLEKNTLQ